MTVLGRRMLVAMVLCAAAAVAQATDEPLQVRTLPSSALVNLERVRLPDGEHMGLLGVGYVAELQPGWWLGPSVYGAATGHRGGLFTWGAEAQRRWRLGEHWGAVAGLYVGGGGGAAAPVGGGLMLRPHADLMIDFGGWQAGLGVSQVRFPSGQIGSTQLGFSLMVEDRFAYAPPGHAGTAVDFSGRGGIGADRMLPTVGRYSSRKDTGGSLGYVGLRLEQQATSSMSATLEAAGAASGGADGYMEALAGLSWQWPLFGPRLQVGARGAVGLAGGGAVATGGGPIGKAALTARWQFAGPYALNLEAGQAKAFNGNFSARFMQLSLAMPLDTRNGPMGTDGLPQRRLSDMEWAFSVLRYQHAQRKDGTVRPMQLVGLAFNRALSPHLYLSGQAHSAITGGAGAYSVGLVGLGARTRFGQAWSAGAEALVGAAGGGGVASQGGAVAQPMVWVAHDLGRYSRIKLQAGEIKSRHGDLSTPVAALTWSFEFGTP